MSRVAWFLLLIPTLLLSAVAPALAAFAVEGSSPSHLLTLRLHRRVTPENARPARYTPFRLTRRQWRFIEVYEHLAYLTMHCLCRKAREEAQSQAGGAVDRLARVLILVRVTDDKAIKQRCTNEAFAELLRQPEWEQIIGSPDELFMTVYHAAYRRDTEWCICKEKLMRPDTAPEMTQAEETALRQRCADIARRFAERKLHEATQEMLLPENERQLQEHSYQPPSTDAALSTAPEPAWTVPRARPASQWGSPPRLREALAERMAVLMNAVTGVPRFMMRDVPAELMRQAAARTLWGGGMAARHVQRLGAVRGR